MAGPAEEREVGTERQQASRQASKRSSHRPSGARIGLQSSARAVRSRSRSPSLLTQRPFYHFPFLLTSRLLRPSAEVNTSDVSEQTLTQHPAPSSHPGLFVAWGACKAWNCSRAALLGDAPRSAVVEILQRRNPTPIAPAKRAGVGTDSKTLATASAEEGGARY